MIIKKEKIKGIAGLICWLLGTTAIILTVWLVVRSVFNSERLAEENNTLLKTIANQDPVQRIHCIIKIEDSIENDEQQEEESEIEAVQEEAQFIDEIQETTETTGKTIGQNVALPDLPTDRKVCTDYRVYNIPGTPHNRLQKLAYTDALGCRRYGNHYIVGMGSAYSDRVGETYEVELDTGIIFTIITGDMKPDKDTDATNRYEACYNYDGEYCANVLEFIIDKEAFDTNAYQWGGVDYYEKFKGDIVRMTYLGRDASADWDIYT